jgi:HlyD family secretion protein
VKRYTAAAALLLGIAACQKEVPAPPYEAVAVSRRDLVVSASASGAIEPILTVDVKSKASGEIMEMFVETGSNVRQGQLLASIDPRVPRNTLAQAEANLVVAEAQLANSRAALERADTLYKTQSITEAEYETAKLGYANANAQVVRAKTDLENARDRMTDTRLRAPLNGTIIQKNVELGTVISSPTQDVGGGTLLFRMANLDTVQIRTLVDETDIGKVQPGLAATITVDAYPNRPFEGRVLKIEPQATVQQNVTMFPVLVRIANPDQLLKPGMNTEVEIHVGRRDSVLAIPYSALRTQRDVASAAQVLGLDPADVQQQLAQGSAPPGGPTTGRDSGSMGGRVQPTGARGADSARAPAGGNTLTLPDGRQVPLPEGVTAEQARTVFRKRMSGQQLTREEEAVSQRLRAAFQRMGGGGAGRPGGGPMRMTRNLDTGNYIVFALRSGKPTPIAVRTGLTDLDYIEVLSGLTDQDTVLVLPSASLLTSQQQSRERMQQMTGGGLPGLRQQTSGTSSPPAQVRVIQ